MIDQKIHKNFPLNWSKLIIAKSVQFFVHNPWVGVQNTGAWGSAPDDDDEGWLVRNSEIQKNILTDPRTSDLSLLEEL